MLHKAAVERSAVYDLGIIYLGCDGTSARAPRMRNGVIAISKEENVPHLPRPHFTLQQVIGRRQRSHLWNGLNFVACSKHYSPQFE